jgi:hypothetical protein
MHIARLTDWPAIGQRVALKSRCCGVQPLLRPVFECETVKNIVKLNNEVENTCLRSSDRPLGSST